MIEKLYGILLYTTMELHTYSLSKTRNLKSYSFWSTGPNGFVRKVIKFQLINYEEQLYNLAFGDSALNSELIDDRAVSNNGDTQVILATVATAAFHFMTDHPGASVFATGSTLVRVKFEINKTTPLWSPSVRACSIIYPKYRLMILFLM
ncbi:DUF6934 family protein [Dyadobacter soli]|uniref:DUF6934 family protein n=1 Tax=Dyadobacter soli TaxID=659014 RepID=UPI000B7D7538